MQMTNEEIVREYRLSADHQRQIEILADENLCRKSDIAKILIDAGCDVPKYWRNKFSPAPSTSQGKTGAAAGSGSGVRCGADGQNRESRGQFLAGAHNA